jgi:hypothetical protein
VKTLAAVLVLTIVVLAVPAAAGAAPPISATCNGGACSADWYKTNVTVAFSGWQADPTVTGTNGCDTATLSSDSANWPRSCAVTYSNGSSSTLPVVIRRDATPPTLTGVAFDRGADSNGWYNHPVGLAFAGADATSGVAGCTSGSYGGPDTGSVSFSGTCSDQAGNVSGAGSSPAIKYDATPPAVSVSLARGPDSEGWYNHPVGFSAAGSDNLSGVASCNSGTFGGGGSVSASCADNAGNVAGAGAPINYDSSAPSIDGVAADRAPDSNGWYNHPVTVAYRGSDGGSGIASCTSTSYKGPDTTDTTITGGCTDHAGNHADGDAFHLKYDSTPPTIKDVAVTSNDKFVALTWNASADATSLSVTRTPGTSGTDASTVFTGPGARYEDRTVENHVKYTYAITATDQAANATTEAVTVTPAALLYSPAQGAVVRTPPLLAWRPIGGAAYYNVQLFYVGRSAGTRWARFDGARPESVQVAGRKVLSVWPLKAHYRLKKSWKYAKKSRKLVPGHYTWIVFPGYGKRSVNKYGPLIGHSDFVIAKP